MKKLMTRFSAAVLMLVMACTLVIPAFATSQTIGAGNIDAGKMGSITIFKYESQGEDLDGTVDNNGLVQAIPDTYKPLANIPFTVYKTNVTVTEYNRIGSTVAMGDPADFDTGTATKVDTVNTDTNGMVKFENLDSNYVYYVVEEKIPTVVKVVAPFFVSVPMTHPTSANEWVYDVTVYPKNTLAGAPGIDKTVTNTSDKENTSYAVGSDVNWIIKAGIPEDITTAQVYTITDTLDSRLDYKAGSATATVGDTAVDVQVVQSGQTLSFTFDATAKATLAAAWTNFTATDALKMPQVLITITTTINATAADKPGEAIPNNAQLDYTNGIGVAYDPAKVGATDEDVNVPKVYVGNVVLQKKDAEDSTLLNGAEFAIYKTEEDAKAGVNAIATVTTAGVDAEAGLAAFKGLAYGEYWIVETKAPTYTDNAGAVHSYNLLGAPFQVTVNGESHKVAQEVLNRKGFVLPITGGIGTTIFTVSGIVLLLGAVALIVVKAKKSKSK